jgi:hypothetical protein
MAKIAAAIISPGNKRPSPIEYLFRKTTLTGTNKGQGPDRVRPAGQKFPDVSWYQIMVSNW